MDLNYKEIGKRIKAARRLREMSQYELAEKIDATAAHISYLENGERNMSLETFLEIVNALNVSADELLTDNLSNKIRSTSQEMLTLLSDCNEFEGRVLLAVMRGAKAAVRETLQKDSHRY